MTASDVTPLVLASSSPRRKQLLREAGLSFEAADPPVAEPVHLGMEVSPARRAEALAYFKARAVADRSEDALVLGADTVVSVDGQLLGKPADADDARRMLRMLSNTRQAVITGVALLGAGRRCIASETTFVTMRQISDSELEDYIASGEWEGKAGAYAIQETADRFVTELEGSFSNVVGLPMELVEQLLRLTEREYVR